MDPILNGQPPVALPTYTPAGSSFSVPVPVFPTTQQHQQQQVGELQQSSFFMPPNQPQASPAQFSNASTHPPYHQMVIDAISALKEREGSSRQAISKYIERFYPNLPEGHGNLLTQQLKKMKENGQLVMVKHSYMLPGSASAEVLADLPVSSVPKRTPGRPPKLKPVVNANSVQQQVVVPPANDVRESVFSAIGLVDGVVEGEPEVKKRPGRPRKRGTADQNVTDDSGNHAGSQPGVAEVAVSGGGDPPAKRRPGRPFKNGSLNVGGGPVSVPVTSPARGRGRPKQSAPVYSGKPRGRPRRNVESPAPVNAVNSTEAEEEVPAQAGGDGAVPTISKRGRPGRPPKRFINEPITKTRQGPAKPVGRFKQNEPATTAQAPTTAHVSNLQQLLAYQELRTKLELFQVRIRHSVGILKPFIQDNQTPSNANEALQELEELSTLDITAPSTLHGLTLLPPNQV